MTANLSKGARFALWTAVIVVGALIAIVIGIGIYVRIAFAPYYEIAKDEFAIPGIEDGFICQDLDYYEETGTWLFSGYSAKEGPSPIYVRDKTGKVTRLYVKTSDGMNYMGHGSGITSTDEFVFLTCDSGYLVFDAEDVMAAQKDSYIQAIDSVDLEFEPAFLNTENETLFVGTFHRIPEYPAPERHYRETQAGTKNGGIIVAYESDEDAPYGFDHVPAYAYSIPDNVQGVCALPNDDIVLSRSWALNPSHIDIYNKRLGAVVDEITIDGEEIDLYILDKNCLVKDIEAPPMSEGIEYVNGRIYIAEESASEKYFIGKLYGAGDVYSIAM